MMEEENTSLSFIEDTTELDSSYIYPQSPKPRRRVSITNPKTPYFIRKGSKFDYLNEEDTITKSFKINANPFTTPARRNHVLETQSPAIIPLVANECRYLSEFEEINLIGQFEDGNLSKCLKRFDGMNYAIKEVKLQKLKNESIIKRIQLMSEMMMSNITPNKHIVKYYTCWKENCNKILYIQQEYCDYCLKYYFNNNNNNNYNEKEMLRMMKHILKAIIYLRNNRYYYYEVNKDNIYIHNNIYKLSLFYSEISSERMELISRNDDEMMIKDDIVNLGMIVYEIIINNNNNKNRVDYFMNKKYSIDFLTVYIYIIFLYFIY